MDDGGQERRRRDVVVPEVVMDRLKVPHDFARRRAEGNDRIGVAVVASALAAEVIRARAARGHENQIALRIGGEDRPGVGRSGSVRHRSPPARPRRIGRITGHGVPAPAKRAGARVIRTHLAAGRVETAIVGDRGAGDE